jgi:hypothetical protein
MLDRMLNQSLVSGANDLEQVWSRLAALQPEELESRP